MGEHPEMEELRPVGPGVFVADYPQQFHRMPIGSRMTVLALGASDLLVHSPVPLTPALRRDLELLGQVQAIVAPNLYHHLYVGDFMSAFPAAPAYACKGLTTKRPELSFVGELTGPPGPWQPFVEYLPFDGNPEHNEVVFFHPSSRTLVVSDLLGNLLDLRGLRMRIFGFVNGWGKFGAPRVLRLLVRDRPAARASRDRILGWDFDRVIMAHGAILETGGHDAVSSALHWL